MKLNLTTAGLFEPQQFTAWSSARRQAIHQAVARGMQAGGRELRDAARGQMRSAFAVKRSGFVNSLHARLIDKKSDRLPALWIGSKIPWLGLHETGGTVSGNLLIPLLPNRIGPKRFHQVISALLQSGNAFFVKKHGKVLLMAENLRENAAPLTRFKRAERQRSGVKRLQRGQEIPIAVLVKAVTLKRRLDLRGTVARELPRLAAAIQQELGKIDGH